MSKVAAFVPLKLKSRRLPNKNFLRLGDHPLAYHVFKALMGVEDIAQVYCYTSQPQVLGLLPEGVQLLLRPPKLDGDDVNANELFEYAALNIDADILVLCHATGPFVSPNSIKKGITAVKSREYDCSFSALRHQTYCWFKGKPLNYDVSDMAQTQALNPVFSETSGFYVFKKDQYLSTGTRIGERPKIVEVGYRESIDIDEPSDFNLATHFLDYDDGVKRYSDDQFFVRLANESIPYQKLSHVAFDLDGVLIDSVPLMERAWDYATQSIGISIPFEEYKKEIGLPFTEILNNLGVDSSLHFSVHEKYDSYSRENEELVKVYTGAEDALSRLKESRIKISVVTSKSKARAHSILRKVFGENFFDSIVTPEDVLVGRGKPNPDPLLKACFSVGVDPDNSLYIGDMEADRQTALRSNVHFVYANWGYGDLMQVKDVWFNEIADLVDYIIG